MTPPPKREDALRSSRPAKPRENFTRHDQALLRAKNEQKLVRFTLAVETDYTDSECSFKAKVLQVDRFSIQVELDPVRKPWIAKPFLVSTEVLP